MIVVTSIVTWLFGEISKSYGWVQSKYIPYQNLLVGLISGILIYATGLGELVPSIIIALGGSLTAGGLYDAVKTKKGE